MYSTYTYISFASLQLKSLLYCNGLKKYIRSEVSAHYFWSVSFVLFHDSCTPSSRYSKPVLLYYIMERHIIIIIIVYKSGYRSKRNKLFNSKTVFCSGKIVLFLRNALIMRMKRKTRWRDNKYSSYSYTHENK